MPLSSALKAYFRLYIQFIMLINLKMMIFNQSFTHYEIIKVTFWPCWRSKSVLFWTCVGGVALSYYLKSFLGFFKTRLINSATNQHFWSNLILPRTLSSFLGSHGILLKLRLRLPGLFIIINVVLYIQKVFIEKRISMY